MKVNKSSIINALKRSYLVSNSLASRTAFNVEISIVKSCTCSDFAKNGHQVLCKYILFIALHVLNGKDLKPPLRIRFIDENDLRNLFDSTGKMSSTSSYANNQLVKGRTFMPFLLNILALLNRKLGKCKKSASGWQNVQSVVAERLLMLKPSVLLSKVLER